jgi:spermidine/putrescine transport system permease protein
MIIQWKKHPWTLEPIELKHFSFITVPVLAPGIFGGALMAFTLSIDDVIISYFTNGQVKTYPLK